METFKRLKTVCENMKQARTVTNELIELLAEKYVIVDAKYILAVECSYYEYKELKTATIDVYMPSLTIKVLYDSDKETEDYRVVVAKDSFECYCGK
ncbi:MAG: hypothetical protein QW607_09190 [Desulfurococcaceae archaeon]